DYDETLAGSAGYFSNGRRGSVFVWLSQASLTSPVWVPRRLLGDDGTIDGYFAAFPYQRDNPGYMMTDEWFNEPRYWAARIRSDYSEDFDDLSRIGGHLLLSTTSRWGIDTEMSRLAEQLPGDGRDHLWLGDCNVVYRFAQGTWGQWRTGIGFNWLDDTIDTEYGFNFTYGFDFYPVKPLVFSTEFDWGTIGSAEAFHFRTTAGVLIHRFESYIGYEYRDIDRFHFNGLVAGVRIWF
ncbi:MAG: hypothetical protein JW888_18940, partial [Pirellulales bacterium]|nr:hypothetical protein [Pirellulales bacterium]